MSGVKITSYVDAIAKEIRADNLADVKAALEIVEAKHNTMIGTIGQLRRRLEKIERAAELEHRVVFNFLDRQ